MSTTSIINHNISAVATCSVIVSQWTSMLRIVAVHLRRMGLRYGIIDGTVNPKQRMDLVEDFNTNSKGPQVHLPSITFQRKTKWGLNVLPSMLMLYE